MQHRPGIYTNILQKRGNYTMTSFIHGTNLTQYLSIMSCLHVTARGSDTHWEQRQSNTKDVF